MWRYLKQVLIAFDRNSTPQTSLFKEGTRRTHFWNVK